MKSFASRAAMAALLTRISDAGYDAPQERFSGLNLSLHSRHIWDIHPNMAAEIDTFDRRILAELQRDGTLSVRPAVGTDRPVAQRLLAAHAVRHRV